MSGRSENQSGLAVARRLSSESAAESPASSAPGHQASPVVPDRSVYLRAIRTSLPRLIRIIGATPWFRDVAHATPRGTTDAKTLYRELGATLAIATLSEIDPGRADRAYLRACVEASLIRWQQSLRSDGRPARRESRRSELHAATMALVIRLLSESACYQTPLSLGDVDRHLRWLSARPEMSPWLEAAAVCAMADGAVLVRDSALLRRSRDRLMALLRRQDSEGWFLESDGPNVSRLSLTVDTLARLYRQNGWTELREPLEAAVRFLSHFVHPDGTVGGSSADECISPYGPELLAPVFPDAAALALVCRRHFDGMNSIRACESNDDQCAEIGAGLAMAATSATAILPAEHACPFERIGQTRFPSAGVYVFSTEAYFAVVSSKRGGSLRVTWKRGDAPLDDSGVTVIFPHRTRTSARYDPRTRVEDAGHAVTSNGILRRVEPSKGSFKRWVKRHIGPLARARRNRPKTRGRSDGKLSQHDYNRLAHDHFTRTVTFGNDWVRIEDRVRCRLRCETIVCQSPPPSCVDLAGRRGPGSRTMRPPIFLEGGKDVSVTRIYRNGRLARASEEVVPVPDPHNNAARDHSQSAPLTAEEAAAPAEGALGSKTACQTNEV